VSAIKELANLSEVEVLRQLKNLQRLHSGDSRSVVDGIAQVCWAASNSHRKESERTRSEPEQTPPRSPKAKRFPFQSISDMSTAASEGDLMERTTPLSAASRSIFLAPPELEEDAELEAEADRSEAKPSVEDAPDSAPYSFLADQEEPDSEPPSSPGNHMKVPLGLRRVLSSVLPSVDNIPEDVLGELGMNMGAVTPKSEGKRDGKIEPRRSVGGHLQRFPLRNNKAQPRGRPEAPRPASGPGSEPGSPDS